MSNLSALFWTGTWTVIPRAQPTIMCTHYHITQQDKLGLKQTWAWNCMYVGMARPDNFQFMLAAEDLKISNAKGILRTTPENQPLELRPHDLNQPSACNKYKIKDSEEVFSWVWKEQTRNVVNTSTLTVYLLATLHRASEVLIKWVCPHCTAGPKSSLPRTELVNDNEQCTCSLQLPVSKRKDYGASSLSIKKNLPLQNSATTEELSSHSLLLIQLC